MTKRHVFRIAQIVLALLLTAVLALFAGCSSSKDAETDPPEADALEAAEIQPTLSDKQLKKMFADSREAKAESVVGDETVVSPYLVTELKKDKVTDEVLTYWYDTYLKDSKYDYAVIVYSDEKDGSGVFGIRGSLLYKNVIMDPDKDYVITESKDATLYMEMNGRLADMSLAVDENGDPAEDAVVEESAD